MAIIGNFYEVGIGKQTGLGSPATSFEGLKWTTLSVEPQAPKAFDEGVIGNIYDVNAAKVYRKGYNLTISGNLDRRPIGILFYALAGQVATTGIGPFTHEFRIVPNSASVPLYSFGVKEGGIRDAIIQDAGINNMSISASVENPAGYEASFVANNANAGSVSLGYLTDASMYVAYEITVEIADNETFNTGVVQLKATEASVEFNRNLQTVQTLGSDAFTVFAFGNLEVTASVKVVLENTSNLDLFMNGTIKALRIKFTDTSTDLGGGVNPSITVTIPAVVVNGNARDISKGEIVFENLEFKGIGPTTPVIQLVNEWDGTQY